MGQMRKGLGGRCTSEACRIGGEETTLQEVSDDPVHIMSYLALTQGD